ncbi:MAG: outer membrane beta-barrel protein [Saprospiraceae bacterium]|nr:outer membrane beta-barrel protein [Saprospiraceae bacterium]
MYAQKGQIYNFDGPSYFIFDPQESRTVVFGIRNVMQEISNSYIEIPILAYAKFGPIELQGGAYAGFLVASTSTGTLTFKANGNNAQPLEFDLDYRFISDEAGEFTGELGFVTFDNRRLPLPNTLGAYYEASSGKENFYRTFDGGLVGAISLYINQGLFLNVRAEYGLTDVTNETRDVSLSALEGKEFIPSNDTDKNISFQASIGFKF